MNIKFDDTFSKLSKKLSDKVENLPQLERTIVQDIANEFLEEVIKQTPKSDSNKLANSWQMKVTKDGNHYIAEVYNTKLYAWDVEYGHRMGDGRWKRGYFMMTITQTMIKERMNKIGQHHVYEFLEDVFK